MTSLLLTLLIVFFPVLMTYRLATDTRDKACDAIVDDIDAGAGAGTIAIHANTQPGSVGGSYGTLLGTLTFSDPAFGASSSGMATASAITSDTNADNSGTAQSFLIADSSANPHSDGSCGQGSGDLDFNNNVIVAGGTIAITAMTITVPIS